MKKLWEFIKKHKKAIIIIVILIVVGFGVVKIAQAVNNAQNLITGMQSSASTEVVEARDIVNSVTATGVVVAVDKRTVSSTVTGVKVKELNVKVGDQVQAGQILCVLDGENFEEQLADAQKMLGVDAGRSSLDVQSSNRGLNEAITQRDISATRAEEDRQTAYNHAQDAGNTCNEAKEKYDTAANNTLAAKWKLDDAWNALQAAKAGTDPDADTINNINKQIEGVARDYTERCGLLCDYVGSIKDKYPDLFVNMHDDTDGLISGEDNYVIWHPTVTEFPSIDAYGPSDTIKQISVLSIYTGDNSDIKATIADHIDAIKNDKMQYDGLVISLSQKQYNGVEMAEAAYQQAKAAYDAALAQEESAKSMYESAAKTVESMWESYNNVVRAGDDTQRNNDSMVASRVDGVKNSQLSSSVATMSDERNIKQLQEQIDGCVVTASIGGIVTDVNVLQGDMYVGGAIVTIENTTDYEVSAQIDEYDIAKIAVGQEVIVKTNGTGLTEMKGEVKSIAPHATVNAMGSSSGVKYEVLISILENNPDIRLDMTAKVEILMEKRENVLSVSSEAIQYDEEENAFVEVLDSGKPIDTSALLSDPESVDQDELDKMQNGEKSYESHNVYVTVGIVGDYYTEIISDELNEGIEIVIPNDGAFSDLEEYMEEAGMIGGF